MMTTDGVFPWLVIFMGCLGIGHGITYRDHYSIIGGVALLLWGVHEVLFVD